MLIPFGLGNQVELRYRQAFPHLSSHYAVLKYHNACGNVLDGVPMECFVEIKRRAVDGAKDYLFSNVSSVLGSLTDMALTFDYLHPDNSETLNTQFWK